MAHPSFLYNRQETPTDGQDNGVDAYYYHYSHAPASAQSRQTIDSAYYSLGSSPDSALQATSPMRPVGPPLLPRVRRDRGMDLTPAPTPLQATATSASISTLSSSATINTSTNVAITGPVRTHRRSASLATGLTSGVTIPPSSDARSGSVGGGGAGYPYAPYRVHPRPHLRTTVSAGCARALTGTTTGLDTGYSCTGATAKGRQRSPSPDADLITPLSAVSGSDTALLSALSSPISFHHHHNNYLNVNQHQQSIDTRRLSVGGNFTSKATGYTPNGGAPTIAGGLTAASNKRLSTSSVASSASSTATTPTAVAGVDGGSGRGGDSGAPSSRKRPCNGVGNLGRRSSGHARSVSASTVDEATVERYGYPTYRKIPTYTSSAAPATASSLAVTTNGASSKTGSATATASCGSNVSAAPLATLHLGTLYGPSMSYPTQAPAGPVGQLPLGMPQHTQFGLHTDAITPSDPDILDAFAGPVLAPSVSSLYFAVPPPPPTVMPGQSARHHELLTYDPSYRFGGPIGDFATDEWTDLSTIPTAAIQPYIDDSSSLYGNYADMAGPSMTVPQPTTTLLDFLTTPNPIPHLVRSPQPDHGRNSTHSWWDVRNLRGWRDFTFDSICAQPEMYRHLTDPVQASRLVDHPSQLQLRHHPHPYHHSLAVPESEAALQQFIWRDYYAAKLDAALSVSQAPGRHLSMQAQQHGPAAAPQGPDFVSDYVGSPSRRGRIVGLVRAHDCWNSGMRNDIDPRRMEYLRTLAHLQRLMRETGCRYGFIATELELVCVRYGGPTETALPARPTNAPFSKSGSDRDPSIPIFGYLELSEAIPVSQHGVCGRLSPPSTYPGADQQQGPKQELTAALALWYLHMLAGDDFAAALPCSSSSVAGVIKPFSWKIDVGPPGALYRQICLPRDKYLPSILESEKRVCKRLRGWAMPAESFNRKETKEANAANARQRNLH